MVVTFCQIPGPGRHPGFGLQSLTNANGNSAFSLGGPPTLLAPNGQGPSSLHHLPRMMDLSNGFVTQPTSSSSPHLLSPAGSPVPKLLSQDGVRSGDYGSPMKTSDEGDDSINKTQSLLG